MGLRFDWDRLKKEWDGTKQVFSGDAVYNPLSGEYVPIGPAARPENPPADLSQMGPNSTEARLAHIEILVRNGSITDAEGAEARSRILNGL